MPVTIVTFSTYLTNTDITWRSVDYDGLNFVKAIKHHPLVGRESRIPVGKAKHLLVESTAQNAHKWFAELAANFLISAKANCPVILVPVPDSGCVTGDREPKMAAAAKVIASRLNCGSLWTGLRWKQAHQPTHITGEKDPQELYKNYVLTSKPPAGTLVLVDDLHTRGSHIVAACAAIRDRGRSCQMAVCAGRRVYDPPADPFAIISEVVADLNPL